MIPSKSVLMACLVALMATDPSGQQSKGGEDETGPYIVVENWMKPIHAGFTQYIDAAFAETPDRIILAAFGEVTTPVATGRGASATPAEPTEANLRREHFVVVLNRNGEVVEDWPLAVQTMVHPHAVQISPYDSEKNVWVIDREGHQICKFSHDGKRLLMSIGQKGVAGNDATHLNRPADLTFLPDGSFLVADGYTGTRVVKFDQNGKYITSWGTRGAGPGQFNLVHCVAVDRAGRMYIADRNNNRIQVLDSTGKFIESWAARRPNHILLTDDLFLWLSDGATNRILKYDLSGNLLSYWGVGGSFSGALNNPHFFTVDSDRNLYVADYANNRVQKFRPKPGVDPSRLVGQPLLLK